MSPTARRSSLLIVIAMSFLLNLWGISYGLPTARRAWDHDEIVPHHVIGSMVYGLEHGTWLVKYPPFQYYVLAPLYRVVFYLGELGWLDRDPALEYNRLFYLTRAVSLLMGTATVLLAYLASRQALGHAASLLAAASYALVAPAVFYAKHGNLDTPYVFWFALSWWLYLRALRFQRLGDYVGFGLAAAMAVGTKDQAYGLYAFAPLPLLVALHRHRRVSGAPTSLVRLFFDHRLVAGALASALLLLGGHQVFSRPAIFTRHVAKITGPYSADYRFFTQDLSGQLANLRLCAANTVFSLGTPLALAAVVGLGLVFLRRGVFAGPSPGPRFLLGSGLLLGLSYHVTFLAVILYNYDRYFMPTALVLAPFAGVALAWAWAARALPARFGAVAVVATLGVSAWRVVVMDLAMVHDTRYVAEDWLSGRLADGEYALAIGDGRRNPRLPSMPWHQLRPDPAATMRSANPRFVVVNATDIGSNLPGSVESAEVVLSGAIGYDVRWRHRYRPPLDVFDPSGTTGSLFFINPEIVVLERRDAPAFARLARLGGRQPSPLLRAAERQRDNGQADKAYVLDRHAVTQAPDDALATAALALDLGALGRHDEAVDLLRRAASRHPGNPVHATALALALLAAGSEEARPAAAEASRLAPDSPVTALLEAETAIASGVGRAAVHALERAVDAEPRDREIVLSAAWMLAEAGALGKAAAAVVGACELPAVSVEASRREAARLLQQVGRDEDARRFLMAARDPRAPTPALTNPGEVRPRVLGTGWEEPSTQLGSFRWVGGCAHLWLEDLGGDAGLEIRYRCGGETEREAWIRVPGRALFPLTCGNDDAQSTILRLEHGLWGGEPFLPLDLEVSPPFLPAEVWGTEDHRELGLQLISVVLRTASEPR